MRVKRIALTAALISSLLVTPVYAEPGVSELESQKAAAESKANAIQAELTELLTKMGQLEDDLIAKGEEIIQAEQDLGKAEKKEKEQYESMKLRIKYMYESGNIDAIEALADSESFSDLINQAEYINSVYRYDRKKLEEYIAVKNEVSDLRGKLQTEQTQMEDMQSEYGIKEQELNRSLQEKKAEIADFDAQIQAAAEAAAAAAREAAEKAAREAASRSANGNANISNGNTGAVNGNAGGSNGGTGAAGGSGNNTSPSGGQAYTGNSAAAQMIVSAAQSQLGVPYVWGGSTPFGGLDCSGLVQYCHSVAGISLPRTSQAQGGCGVAVSSPLPGDIVCYGTHVGIYIGGGQMIHAPKPGQVVKVAAVYGSPWYRRCW